MRSPRPIRKSEKGTPSSRSTIQHRPSTSRYPSSDRGHPSFHPNWYNPAFRNELIAVEQGTPEFNNLSEVSIFALPKFDPEKEMRILQNLWSKRCSIGDPQPLICRSPRTSHEIVDDGGDRSQERSFFETDSDSDDEENSVRRFVF